MATSTPARLHVNLNAFFAACLSGAAAGVLVGGVISRISMRAVALLIGSAGEFSLGGTFAILLVGGVFGVIFGGLYAFVRHAFPLRPIWRGAAYGALWAALTCYFFFVNREGELGLIGPEIGAALFAPIPVLQGMGMAWLLARLERRLAGATVRTVPAHWFVGLNLAALLAAVGMGSLAGDGLRLPSLIFNATTRLGVNFAAVTGLHQFLGFLFLLVWICLCVLLFALNSVSSRGRLTALAFLLMAAGLFHVQPPFSGMMAGIPVGRWSSAVLSGAGAGALLALLLGLPDRALIRAEWSGIGAAGVAVLLWQGTSLHRLTIQQPALEWIVWAVCLAVLGGSVAIGRTRSRRPAAGRSVFLVWTLALGCFLAIWVATLLVPAWNIRGNVHPFAPLGVTVYLLPWLLPLLRIMLAAGRDMWASE